MAKDRTNRDEAQAAGDQSDTQSDTSRPGDALPPAGDLVEVIEGRVIEPTEGRATSSPVRRTDGAEVETFVLQDHPAMQALNAWMMANLGDGNAADLAVADIIAQVLSATSYDEVLADVRAVGMRDMLGVPMRLLSAKAHRSSYEARARWFFYCKVQRLDTGEELGVTTGAATVLAQIVRLHMLNAVPCDIMPVLATKEPTQSGGTPYRLSFPRPTALGAQ